MPLVRTAQSSSNRHNRASLHMIAPRVHLHQSVLVSDTALTTPSQAVAAPAAAAVFNEQQQWRITQILAFAGTLYFDTAVEQTRYTEFISVYKASHSSTTAAV
jgi:hypothetical protein